MALFTDGNISRIDDLRAYDAGILSVASAESVDLAAKLSLATAEIGVELEEFFSRRSGGRDSWSTAPISRENVVVTPALQQWHTLLSLALIYGDVQGNHVNSRYEFKWKDFRRRARWTSETLFRTGVGLTSTPIPRAAAPTVHTVPGSLPLETYHLSVAWRSASGESGAASETVIYTLDSDGVPAVQPGASPAVAIGYDVFAGSAAESMSRQNEDIVPLGTEWTMPGSGLIEGVAPSTGQEPAWYLRNDRVLQRG